MEIFWDFSDKITTFDSFNRDMNEIVSNLENLPLKSVVVAVSGGSDSLSLLILMVNWAKNRNIVVKCITVDHKLRSESRDEALFVQNFCRQLGIDHTILDWNHFSGIDHGKLESLAREARYKLISDFCKQEDIHVAAVGHNWNDQLETFAMREEQKSGEAGLAGMSRIRSIAADTVLIRPVLHFTKQHLKDFLASQNIFWKEDPMNEDENFKRVFYRKNICAKSRENLQQITQKIISFGKVRQEIDKKAVCFLNEYFNQKFKTTILNEHLKQSFKTIILNEHLKQLFQTFGYAIFDTPRFLCEDIDVQIEILRRIIWNIGGKKYPPKIDDGILQKIFDLKSAGKIFTIGRCSLRVNKKHIYIFRENRNLDEEIEISADRSKYIFDDRFLISIKTEKNSSDMSIKYVISSLRDKLADLGSKYREIPANAVYGLPCITANTASDEKKHIVFAYGLKTKYSENLSISCKFINKVNLFDVFL